MKLTSYAQNFEDIMLWRALRGIGEGRYVDVGAQHPRVDSVSRLFYEQGWRGVHIEPVPEYADLLRKDRPDESVFQVALGPAPGVTVINVVPNTGLSTGIEEFAKRHEQHRGLVYFPISVPVVTLDSILDQYADVPVHWLKIDVEGMEDRVLLGWDRKSVRPWIVVVEATLPDSTEESFESWEPLLLGSSYKFVYFDGLNRFYVASERHGELKGAFNRPPNVFDDFRLSGMASAEWCRGVQSEERSRQEALERDLASTRALLQASTELVGNEEERARFLADELARVTSKWREASAATATLADRAAKAERELAQMEDRAASFNIERASLLDRHESLTREAARLELELKQAHDTVKVAAIEQGRAEAQLSDCVAQLGHVRDEAKSAWDAHREALRLLGEERAARLAEEAAHQRTRSQVELLRLTAGSAVDEASRERTSAERTIAMLQRATERAGQLEEKMEQLGRGKADGPAADIPAAPRPGSLVADDGRQILSERARRVFFELRGARSLIR